MGAASLALIAVLLLLRPGFGSRETGTVESLVGQPQYRVAGSGWQPLTDAELVPSGAVLRTGDVDVVEIQFADGSRVQVDFDSQLLVGPRQEAETGATRADFDLQRGHAWFLVTPDRRGLRVRTAAGTAEAMGTMFAVSTREQRNAGEAEPGGGRHRARRPRAVVERAGHGRRRARNDGRGNLQTTRPLRSRVVPSVSTLLAQAPWGRSEATAWQLPELELEDAAGRVAGRRGFVGVRLAATALAANGRPRFEPGLTVMSVAEGSTALQAGLVRGDRMLQVGRFVLLHPGDLERAQCAYLPGDKTTLVLLHKGQTRRVSVVLGDHPASRDFPVAPALERANLDLAEGRTAQAQREYAALADSPFAAAAVTTSASSPKRWAWCRKPKPTTSRPLRAPRRGALSLQPRARAGPPGQSNRLGSRVPGHRRAGSGRFPSALPIGTPAGIAGRT